MYRYFDGDFRRRPQQNLGGQRKKLQREELIQKAASERKQREELRRQIQSAITIQSYVRGFLSRTRDYRQFRKEFDDSVNSLSKESLSPDLLTMGSLIQRLILFYSEKKDHQRLIWLSQHLIKQIDTIVKTLTIDASLWLYRLKRVLNFNIKDLRNCTVANSQLPIATSMRVLELYTSGNSYLAINSVLDTNHILTSLWDFLITNQFFSDMRILFDVKIPAPYEFNRNPPTPLAASLLEITLRPFRMELNDDEIRSRFINHFLSELLRGPFTPHVRYFLLPAISFNTLPLLKCQYIVSALLPQTQTDSGNLYKYNGLALPNNCWLLYSVIKLISKQISNMNASDMSKYLKMLSLLTPTLFEVIKHKFEESDDNNDNADSMDISEHNEFDVISVIFNEILEMLNDHHHVQSILSLIDNDDPNEIDNEILVSLSSVCHSLLSCHPLSVNQYRLLYTFAFKPQFLRMLWKYITGISTPSVFGSPTSLLYILSRGLPLAAVDWDHILPHLTLFCSLFSYLLPTLDDVEFYEHPDTVFTNGKLIYTIPFSLQELASMSLTLRDVCIGLVELAYHDARPSIRDDYQNALKSVRVNDVENETDDEKSQVHHWTKLFKSCVNLLRQLHARDSRRQFCPPNHWISKQVIIPVERPTSFGVGIQQRRMYRQFVGLRHLTREELEEYGPPLSTTEVRNVTILQEIPFVVSFHDRVKILQILMARDKLQHRGESHNFMVPGSMIQIIIRRNYIYEDAFEKLSPENEPNLKQSLRVQLINAIGLDEAGIDGGGIFREFLSEVLKTAFDPNRGFFSSTHDRLLYPNPSVNLLVDDYLKHYYFIGRMLGKAIYDNMLVELPFATFFLVKLLARHLTSDIDIHHLASLDPVVYKNLVFLKSYEGDVSELGLDFTTMNSDLGANQVVELKPGGANITVTAQNRIEYIHLMADYRLNKQIRTHCSFFKQGLADVLDLDWLRMFDPRELQILISGAPTPIDIDDLKKHTNYAGGFSEDHPVINIFWRVLKNFSEHDKRKLLKFVTSCSRPPLLGFKDLFPAFCIQNAGREPNRLPTASTCMNLLKLPEFQDEETMSQKLHYAVDSGAGFELS